MKSTRLKSTDIIPLAQEATQAREADNLFRKTGYARSSQNALKHGILSRYTVLPHEDSAEYQALLVVLVEEHDPRGTTEMHLVEELAGVIWRKRRVLTCWRSWRATRRILTASSSGLWQCCSS